MARVAIAVALIAMSSCADSWRYGRPIEAQSVEGVAVPIASTVLENNLTVATSATPSPLAHIALVWRLSALRGTAQTWLLQRLVADALFRDSRWTSVLTHLGAVSDVSAYRDGVVVAATVLARDQQAIVEALGRIVADPRCNSVQLDRGKALVQRSVNLPDSVAKADRAFTDAVYGPAHPYSQLDATVLASIDCTAVDAFAATYLRGDRLAVIATGYVDHDVFVKAVGQSFAINAGSSPSTTTAAVPNDAAGRAVFIDIDDAAETLIMFGRFLPARDDDSTFQQVMLHSVGGSVSSKLRGDAVVYGVRGEATRQTLGYELRFSTTVAKDGTQDALESIVDRLDHYPTRRRSHGIVDDAYRISTLESAMLREEDISEHANRIADAFMVGREFASVANDLILLMNTDMQSITSWVGHAAQARSMVFVLVGDPAIIRAAAHAAGLD